MTLKQKKYTAWTVGGISVLALSVYSLVAFLFYSRWYTVCWYFWFSIVSIMLGGIFVSELSVVFLF